MRKIVEQINIANVKNSKLQVQDSDVVVELKQIQNLLKTIIFVLGLIVPPVFWLAIK